MSSCVNAHRSLCAMHTAYGSMCCLLMHGCDLRNREREQSQPSMILPLPSPILSYTHPMFPDLASVYTLSAYTLPPQDNAASHEQVLRFTRGHVFRLQSRNRRCSAGITSGLPWGRRSGCCRRMCKRTYREPLPRKPRSAQRAGPVRLCPEARRKVFRSPGRSFVRRR